MSDLSVYIDLIGNIGFPILLVFYLLNRTEKKLDTIIQLMTESLNLLKPLSQVQPT
ncbi:MAG: YvrJ family protein [Bavariicoccus seileri]